MTPMERLAAVATRKPVDRLPVFCNLLDQGARALGMGIEEYYRSGAHVAEAQLRMQRRWGHDNVWALFYVGKEAELLGCRKMVFAEDGPPNVGEWVIRSPEDIHRLEVPTDLAGHPAFAETLRCARLLRAEVGGKVPICVYVTSSVTLPAILMGMEAWLGLLLTGPEELRDELLAKCSALVRAEIAAYRAVGADIILYSIPFASPDFLPARLCRTLALPWAVRDLAPGGMAGIVWYVGTARMEGMAAEARRQLGAEAFYPGPRDDPRRLRTELGPEPLVAGVLNDIELVRWEPDRIRAEVRSLVEALDGGPAIFGTMLMPLAVPERSIAVMLEAAFAACARRGQP